VGRTIAMGNLLPQEFKDYKTILSAYHISFIEDDYWLLVNKTEEKKNLFVFLSFKCIYVLSILRQVLPILKRHNLTFKFIKNEQILLKLNNGGFGNDVIGKNMVIYFDSTADAKIIAKEISSVTNIFRGPVISECIQTGEIIYIPADFKGVFDIPKSYARKTKKIIGKYYLPYQLIHRSHKTEIWKAVNLKGFGFSPCIIKKAIAFRSEDKYGRDMYDRILWEKKLLSDLIDIIPVPGFVDFFEMKQDHYLVTEYIQGVSLEAKIKSLLSRCSWQELSSGSKSEILNYYLYVIGIIQRMHDAGYIHRDITAGNLLIKNRDALYILDLELAYSIKGKKPNPSYILGSHGYMSPEQLVNEVPTEKEDIFSLGALFLFTVTGTHPKNFIGENAEADFQKIEDVISDQCFRKILAGCLNPNACERPALSDIRNEIIEWLKGMDNVQRKIGKIKLFMHEKEYFA